jgi:hypothetical protein
MHSTIVLHILNQQRQKTIIGLQNIDQPVFAVVNVLLFTHM